jgi:hypothetical protein
MRLAGTTTFAVFIMAASAQAATLGPPLQPASEGKLQCYSPNTERRTCRSLAGYELKPDGTIANSATVLLASEPVVVMATVSQVTIKNGQVCGLVRREDVQNASFAIGGAPASPEQTSALRDRLTTAMASLFGVEACTTYETAAGTMTAQAYIGGVRRPEADQTVIWVSPSDGYKVGP